ncbi:ABC transporter ATP-binding protein [Candidatus Parcubacteria bacterium]|nr:ABC transporter ATP-binding protein [Candidatus Parcubacteria bacterium]
MIEIQIKNLYKEFDVRAKNKRLLKQMYHLIRHKFTRETRPVLKGVSLNIKGGEIVGLIGNNGSGKSTMLRLIGGIHKRYQGEIKVEGKVTSLIGLAIGLNPRLTLIENTYLAGSLLGMAFSEIKEKLDSIVKFAELEEFRDTKVYQFSQGMRSRLAISIALHTDPEIFLGDEIFTKLDEHFKNKTLKELEKITLNGGIVILVEHQLELLEDHCKRIIWLEEGLIKRDGKPGDVADEYERVNEF